MFIWKKVTSKKKLFLNNFWNISKLFTSVILSTSINNNLYDYDSFSCYFLNRKHFLVLIYNQQKGSGTLENP